MTFTVTAEDQFGEIATAFAQTVHFSSSDALAVLPADATLTNGVGAFTATFKTAATQTLTATAVGNATVTGSLAFSVNGGPATHFSLTPSLPLSKRARALSSSWWPGIVSTTSLPTIAAPSTSQAPTPRPRSRPTPR